MGTGIFSRLGLFKKAEVVLEEKLKENPYYPFEKVKHEVDFADEGCSGDEANSADEEKITG